MGKGKGKNSGDNDSEEGGGGANTPFDPEKIEEIITRWREIEEEMDALKDEQKGLKRRALQEAGVSAKQFSETLRFLNMEDNERNVLISQAGRCCEAVGRSAISTKTFEN